VGRSGIPAGMRPQRADGTPRQPLIDEALTTWVACTAYGLGYLSAMVDGPPVEAFPKANRATRWIGTVTGWLGSVPAILGSVLIIVVWALTGPVFGYSDTWQLIINTGTTIITFNMVFVIQNTQNRDGRAIQAKLDEQGLALSAVLEALDLSPQDRLELDRLVGVEDAPETDIKDEQRRIHTRSETTPVDDEPARRVP
jgi:low affinity Fe/Cu permease